MNALIKIRTLAALGLPSLARVAFYRLGLRTGLHPVLRVRADQPVGPFFLSSGRAAPTGVIARKSWQGRALYFGWYHRPLDGPPDWRANPFRPGARFGVHLPWWKIGDFDAAVGDIKTVWEASRFDWLIAMVQRAALGDKGELERLNDWLQDWIAHNPPFFGPNWKCGQEASIRVMHLALAALLLDQTGQPAPGLVALIKLHLRRIAPTMGYAIGQQNNHGTSEAAALFIGGSWLERLGDTGGRKWRAIGWKWLRNRARTLIERDGTFSQYSVTYHRVMLDTYSLVEVWRRRLALPGFDAGTLDRLVAATHWLSQLVDPASGDVPNIGANDGARLVPLTDSDFRDFRPAVQLASALFTNRVAVAGGGLWDQPSQWLGVESPTDPVLDLISESFDDGGLHVLRHSGAIAYMRYPRFRFRPSQADALHLDVWIRGENILRDAGTYSYNASDRDTAYFSGTTAHNSVTFDGRDQMPRLGRFLFGAWLRAHGVVTIAASGPFPHAAAGYRDYRGATHLRDVTLRDGQLTCTDMIGGQFRTAVLRWRLAPGAWTRVGNAISNGAIQLKVTADHPIASIALVDERESRYYLQETPLPVLRIEIHAPATLTTELTF